MTLVDAADRYVGGDSSGHRSRISIKLAWHITVIISASIAIDHILNAALFVCRRSVSRGMQHFTSSSLMCDGRYSYSWINDSFPLLHMHGHSSQHITHTAMHDGEYSITHVVVFDIYTSIPPYFNI